MERVRLLRIAYSLIKGPREEHGRKKVYDQCNRSFTTYTFGIGFLIIASWRKEFHAYEQFVETEAIFPSLNKLVGSSDGC